MKPDWKDAPEWANWVAMDQSGKWFWYKTKPIIKGLCWDLGADGDDFRPAEVTDWKDTLQERPV